MPVDAGIILQHVWKTQRSQLCVLPSIRPDLLYTLRRKLKQQYTTYLCEGRPETSFWAASRRLLAMGKVLNENLKRAHPGPSCLWCMVNSIGDAVTTSISMRELSLYLLGSRPRVHILLAFYEVSDTHIGHCSTMIRPQTSLRAAYFLERLLLPFFANLPPSW